LSGWGVMVLADRRRILSLSLGPSGEVLRAMASMDWDDYLRHEAAMYRQLAEKSENVFGKQELLDLAAVCEEVANNIEDRLTGGEPFSAGVRATPQGRAGGSRGPHNEGAAHFPSSVNRSSWYPWPPLARSEPTCMASASQLRTLNRLRAEALGGDL